MRYEIKGQNRPFRHFRSNVNERKWCFVRAKAYAVFFHYYKNLSRFNFSTGFTKTALLFIAKP